MSDQFRFARQAHEVMADHLERSFGRLAARPSVDQQAGNDRTVCLDLESVLVVTD